ncbi:hypothetical protein [Mucilaginibacter sp. PAMB04168]|uniref:hypothetical protein n=1 Tax=Mucilaginibacter sp. PAMB04168 TaxID=3138567 RepID=UPI0031F6D071
MKTLEPLEHLLARLLGDLPASVDPDWSEYVLELFTAEQDRIIQTIRETIYSFHGDPGRRSEHIEYLQTELSKLSDRYYALLPDSAERHPEHLVLQTLLAALNYIYRSLQELYGVAFNDQLKVPLALKASFIAENRKMAFKILRALTSAGEDRALLRLIADYLDVLSRPVYRPVHNSRELDYQLHWVQSLHALAQAYSGDELRARLFPELVHLNFNYFPVICYYTRMLQTNDAEVEFYQEELVRVAEKLRDLRSIPINIHYGYEQGTESLGYILAKALEEEAATLKKKLRIQSRITYKKWENMLFTPFFLHAAATMEQVIYFFRVLIEIGFFVHRKKVVYFDYVAKHVETDGQQGFSPGSVKNKYNNPKHATAEKVKEVFLNAVRWINDNPPMD